MASTLKTKAATEMSGSGFRFIHTSDNHLGYKQYEKEARIDDLGESWLYICKQAVERNVDLLLQAGDLFERTRNLDMYAVRQAKEGLWLLKEAGIPVIAIEGNHDQRPYGWRESQLEHLDREGWLQLLKPKYHEGELVVQKYSEGEAGGLFTDIKTDGGTVRIYGLGWLGSLAEARLKELAPKIERADFTILALHAGIPGVIPAMDESCVSDELLNSLSVDYVALGHVHKAFNRGKIWNAGAPEYHGVEEVDYDKGFLDVTVKDGRPWQVKLEETPRRQLQKWNVNLDGLKTSEEVLTSIRDVVKQRLPAQPETAPVIGVYLQGTTDAPIEARAIEKMLLEAGALHAIVANHTKRAEMQFDVAAKDRAVIEFEVLRSLVPSRYKHVAEEFARLVVDVRNAATEKKPGEVLTDSLLRPWASAHILQQDAKTGERAC